jgi:hypothetical protein
MKTLILLVLPAFVTAQSQNLKYSWRKISGPNQYKIVSPHTAHTNVTNLTVGVYQFELTVTNIKGLSARDTMMVTVKPPASFIANKKFSGSAQLASN